MNNSPAAFVVCARKSASNAEKSAPCIKWIIASVVRKHAGNAPMNAEKWPPDKKGEQIPLYRFSKKKAMQKKENKPVV